MDNKKKINLKKDSTTQQSQNINPRKIEYKNIFIILLVFILGFCFGKLSDKNNTTIQSTNVVENTTGNIVAPFKSSDMVITAEAAEQTSEGYMIRGKITNNSNIPFENIIVTINVNNGDDVAYFDTVGTTIMPGESFAGESISTKKIKSLKAVEANIEWSDNNNKYYSDVDLQLNKIESYIKNY